MTRRTIVLLLATSLASVGLSFAPLSAAHVCRAQTADGCGPCKDGEDHSHTNIDGVPYCTSSSGGDPDPGPTPVPCDVEIDDVICIILYPVGFVGDRAPPFSIHRDVPPGVLA